MKVFIGTKVERLFTENLKECSPGMVCRTMIRSYRHGSNESNEYAYCFPTPEKRKRKCTEQDKVIEPRRSSRTNRSHNENINDRTLPGIPCPDVMRRPIILEILKKRKTSISVLDVIGNVQQVECTTPQKKKKVHASSTNIVSPDPMNNKQDLPTTGSSHVLALRCKNNNLPVTRSVQTGRIPHWEGTSKGLVNICVERGLVPLQKLLVDKQYYTKQGKKVNGEIDERTSLVFILGECADFKNEVSVLQKIADKYNAVVWFTPKYHCEIAGEGVEYAWGYGKRIYRRVPMKEKKKKQDFESLVKRIFSRETISSTVIRRFSGRARQYICSYHVLHNQQKQGDLKEKLSISLAEVEKVAKQFKTHRCALDFDFRFIEAEVENSGAGSKKLNQVKRDLLKFIPVSNMKLYPGSQFDRSGGNGKRK